MDLKMGSLVPALKVQNWLRGEPLALGFIVAGAVLL